jgi:5-formyltetrahydrofolate cyclo-ligase
VVVDRGRPLEFRLWSPTVPMLSGPFGLPRPQGTPSVVPQMLLMPPVGWDERGYRLGYGAGYYDRTLAAMQPPPLKVGVGFECSRIHTIDPQAYDIAMDFMITEAAVYAAGAQGLRPWKEADAV